MSDQKIDQMKEMDRIDALGDSRAALAPDTARPAVHKRDVQFRLTRDLSLHSWMAYIRETPDGEWRKLRPAETTFESAQAAVYDEMIAWAFPR